MKISIEVLKAVEKEINSLDSDKTFYFEFLEKHFRQKIPQLVEIILDTQAKINSGRLSDGSLSPSLKVYYFFLYILRLIEKSIGQDLQVMCTYFLHFLDNLRAYENYAQFNPRREVSVD